MNIRGIIMRKSLKVHIINYHFLCFCPCFMLSFNCTIFLITARVHGKKSKVTALVLSYPASPRRLDSHAIQICCAILGDNLITSNFCLFLSSSLRCVSCSYAILLPNAISCTFCFVKFSLGSRFIFGCCDTKERF